MHNINWIEAINTLVNTLIAIAAFALAILQYRNEIRERKKDNDEQDRIHENILLIKEIADLTIFTEFEEFATQYNNVTRKIDTEHIIQANRYIQQVAVQYKKCIEKLKPLYEKLVLNEEKFSLSYGYGRYIDAFREFITNQDDLDQLIHNIYFMNKNLTNLANSKDEQEQYLKLFCENKKLATTLYYNEKRIASLIAEIRIKYGEYISKN